MSLSAETEKDIALQVSDVAIRYRIGDFKDIGLKEWVTRHLTGNYHEEEFMAVDGVNFTLYKGEMLGIIGSNGAGKSTLLKAISGIMEPTRGQVVRHGNIAALLELGSGFDGNLTVQENTYLRGAMLGYTKQFMDNAYQEIIDFAELQDFTQRPFKQLSSGMQSRLAFSIASLVHPDILILDEVLSVGDGSFNKKSAEKMQEIISSGATTILVSHSIAQVRQLCSKVLWLHKGKQIAFGETQKICDLYEDFLLRSRPLEEIIASLNVDLQATEQTAKTKTYSTPDPAFASESDSILSAQLPVSHRDCWLDLLRIFSIFYVFLFHFNIHFSPDWHPTITTLLSLGGCFMALMFMLSGYTLYMATQNQNLNTGSACIQFYNKRLKRILPEYFAFLLILFFMTRGQLSKSLLLLFPVELTATQSLYTSLWDYFSNSGTWFISTIVILYFLFPLLKMLVDQIKHPVLVLLLLYVAASYPSVVEMNFGGAGYYTHPAFRIAEFSTGILLAKMSICWRSQGASVHFLIPRWLYTACLIFGSIVACKLLCVLAPTLGGEFYRYNFLLIPCFCYALIGGNFFHIPDNTHISNIIIWLSSITYPFYVMQPIANSITKDLLLPILMPNISLAIADFIVNLGLAVVLQIFLKIIRRQLRRTR